MNKGISEVTCRRSPLVGAMPEAYRCPAWRTVQMDLSHFPYPHSLASAFRTPSGPGCRPPHPQSRQPPGVCFPRQPPWSAPTAGASSQQCSWSTTSQSWDSGQYRSPCFQDDRTWTWPCCHSLPPEGPANSFRLLKSSRFLLAICSLYITVNLTTK